MKKKKPTPPLKVTSLPLSWGTTTCTATVLSESEFTNMTRQKKELMIDQLRQHADRIDRLEIYLFWQCTAVLVIGSIAVAAILAASGIIK